MDQKQILESIKGCNSVANLRKTTIYNSNIDLVSDDVYTNLVSFCQFVLKTLSKNQILASMIMCIQNLIKSCPFILKIWSKIKFLIQSRVVTPLQEQPRKDLL